jgi:uncharacterized protein (DUF2062 family)
LKLSRQLKYYYLKFVRLKGNPNELALGMALGIFAGLLPILPFQTALAVALALLFRSSKITAAIGTWISNPLNWYFLYYYTYKVGAFVLGVSGKEALFSRLMKSIRHAEGSLDIAVQIFQAGTTMVSSFVTGGIVLGIVFAVPGYFVFFYIFRSIALWREIRRKDRQEKRHDH